MLDENKASITNLPLPDVLLEVTLPELEEPPTSKVTSVVSLKLLVSPGSSEDGVVDRSVWGQRTISCQVMSRLPTSITDNSCRL